MATPVDMSDVTTEDQNERRWIELVRQDADRQLSGREKEALTAAELNAGQTGDERGYEDHTAEWYRVFVSSYEFMLDTLPPDVKPLVLAHIKRFYFQNELVIAKALDLPVLDVLEALLELERTDADVITRDSVIGYVGHTDRIG